MNTAISQAVLKALLALKRPHLGGFHPPPDGMCGYVHRSLREYNTSGDLENIQLLLIDLCSRWPEYSGIWNYPVLCPEGGCPKEAYRSSIGNLWDKSTPYGQARWRLVDYLIETLQKELA